MRKQNRYKLGDNLKLLRVGLQASRWLSGKESACQCRRHAFDPWVGKIPWRWKWQPTPVFLPEKFHGHRSLMGYSSLDCKESTTSECTHTHTHAHVHTHTHTPPQGLVFTSKRVRNCLKIRQNSGQKPSSALWNPMYWDSGSVLTNLDPQRVPCEDKHEHCRSIFCISGGTVWHQLAQTRVCWIELKRHRSCFGNSASTLWNFQSSSDCFFLQVGVELWTDVSLWSLVDCKLKSDSLNECLLSACSTLGIH